MIIDSLDNMPLYSYGPIWAQAGDFLKTLTPESAEKKYTLLGDDLFAQVASYETRSFDSAVHEAHLKYVDIQVVLSGRERIEVIPKAGLEVDIPYDEEKDVEFFKGTEGDYCVDLRPGYFTLLFPHEAHMPGLTAGEKARSVKKVVVKISVDLLLGGS